MQFDSFASFIAMGGYAFYVWISFFITFGAMAVIAVQSYLKQKTLLRTVIKERERRARIQRAHKSAQNKID